MGLEIVMPAGVWRGLWLPGRPLCAEFSFGPDRIGWLGLAAIAAIVLVVGLHYFHEQHVTRRAVAKALHGRARTTDEEFARRFCPPDMGPVAARVRRLLADNLSCDLSGLVPSDDFEAWLHRFPGPDSAADTFFEELAAEFQLSRQCPWPERFGSFDALVRFVAACEQATKREGSKPSQQLK